MSHAEPHGLEVYDPAADVKKVKIAGQKWIEGGYKIADAKAFQSAWNILDLQTKLHHSSSIAIFAVPQMAASEQISNYDRYVKDRVKPKEAESRTQFMMAQRYKGKLHFANTEKK
eukprot:390561_1